MDDEQSKLNQLLKRLESLIARQEHFSKEINELRSEINQLKVEEVIPSPEREPGIKIPKSKGIHQNPIETQPPFEVPATEILKETKPSRVKEDLEKFIGENLINKIGIAITIIGVSIGVKYSVDHELVTPLMRVVSGYLAGVVLLIVGAKLKSNYDQYSAVLISGAMAIMYFITFAAYSYYELMHVILAFGVMVIFTIFTVLASLSYNKQVISLIGMVGAYAVPFLLSNDSGNVNILLGYISIINIGILVVALLRYWKLLYYSSFILSWLIFGFWIFSDFRIEDHFGLALVFSSIFFLTFYTTFLANKLLKQEKFNMGDIAFLVMNSFIFYGIGYTILDQHEIGNELLGLFTMANAFIHFVVSLIVFRQSQSDRNVFFLIVGVALVFVTIAIPVQLDGYWVTLLWIGEAACLFWIGRTKGVPVYEKLSYPLIPIAFLSLLHDWSRVYQRYIPNNPEEVVLPVFNVQFLSTLIFIVCLGFILYLYNQRKYPAPSLIKLVNDIIYFSIPAMLLFVVYFSIRNEIANYWNQLYAQSAVEIRGNGDYSRYVYNYSLSDFKSVWIVNYSLLLFTVLSVLNIKKFKSKQLATFSLLFNALVLVIFLTFGLYVLSDLREAYLSQFQAEYYDNGIYNLLIRYISFVFVVGLIVTNRQYLDQQMFKKDMRVLFGVGTHIAILWILSSELIHWLDIAGSSKAYKLGLSILWAIYSLLMIVLGIWKHKKYLRIMGIVIFAVTLVKLFLYDVSHLETLAKTILFVSLGVLLLMISFLYNKYKHIIADEE